MYFFVNRGSLENFLYTLVNDPRSYKLLRQQRELAVCVQNISSNRETLSVIAVEVTAITAFLHSTCELNAILTLHISTTHRLSEVQYQPMELFLYILATLSYNCTAHITGTNDLAELIYSMTKALGRYMVMNS
jgi:hypothetical protein